MGLISPLHPIKIKSELQKMSNKKAIGPDGIPIEACKCLREDGIALLTNFFNRMLLTSKMPDATRLSTIVPIYKGKGSKYECNNYRGIKLKRNSKPQPPGSRPIACTFEPTYRYPPP